MSLATLSKNTQLILFLSILSLVGCIEGEKTRFFKGKSSVDTFVQASSNIYTDVFVQNSSRNVITKSFAQNTIETVEENHSQITLRAVEEVFSQNTIGPEKEEIFSQDYSNSVDILWVVDNTRSMQRVQTSLANNFDSFIDIFLDQHLDIIDFQMAIITTESSVNRDTEKKLTSAGAKSNKTDFKNYFKEKIRVGAESWNPHERGLYYSKEFIEQESEKNPPWIRPDAYLMVIYISDEDDFSNVSISDETNQNAFPVESNVLKMKSYKTDPEKLKLFSIVSIRDDPDHPYDSVGERYMEASRLTGGSVYDITQPFNTILNSIGTSIINLMKAPLTLSRKNIDPDSITVYIDDVQSPQNKWTYKSEDNTLAFKADAIPPHGSKVKVLYKVGRLLSRFSLQNTGTFSPKNINVLVNNVDVPQTNWSYNQSDRSIRFTENSIPSEGENIKVTYKVGNLLTSFPVGSSFSSASRETLQVFKNNTLVPTSQWQYRDGRVHFLEGFVPQEKEKIKLVYNKNSLLNTFPLDTPVDPAKMDTIKVFVNNTPSPRNRWEYRDISLRFKRKYLPPSKANIQIEYDGSKKLFPAFNIRNKVNPAQVHVYVSGVKLSENHWEYKKQAVHFKQGHIPGEGVQIKIIYRSSVTLLTDFPLEEKLDIKQLDLVEITVDGNIIPKEGWEYKETTNTIHFNDGFVPKEGERIEVVYYPDL